ncbi:Holliday junction branch migration protein RuvA [Candidatus Contubernalis alkaliaceticus]|uniref:Holliday junction branch migration protein RuvA n=1 Tax=Candidatus Contubernalis alkaliaceticus TaxID=338645 RepID=UPI001F4BEAB5|nr:Holliday junction branch migration protein RuvA [Candidatus Contubernalis alkalaceticus]UNC92625.1 Holliday junction branch migration protein RuvA [Candidatus Contubernalis alkalaceticus]
MLSYICGKLVQAGTDYIVVENNKLGYKIHIAPGGHSLLPQKNDEVKIYTHLYLKEDQIILYGFLQPDDVALFQLLLTVSGVGPKLAVAVTGTMSAAAFYLAVINEDVNTLTGIPGVGKKSSKRLILELKEKITALTKESGILLQEQAGSDNFQELLEALSSLGYGQKESLEAIRYVQGQENADKSLEEILRLSLKYLAG